MYRYEQGEGGYQEEDRPVYTNGDRKVYRLKRPCGGRDHTVWGPTVTGRAARIAACYGYHDAKTICDKSD